MTTLTPERVAEMRANKAWQSPSLAELDALLDVWEAARELNAVCEGLVDLVKAACPDASSWDAEGGLADQYDAAQIAYRKALGGGR